MGSCKPADISTCLLDKSGKVSGTRGIIGLKRIKLDKISGRSKSIPAAILAPLEYPIANVRFKSKSYILDASRTKSAIHLYEILNLLYQKYLQPAYEKNEAYHFLKPPTRTKN